MEHLFIDLPVDADELDPVAVSVDGDHPVAHRPRRQREGYVTRENRAASRNQIISRHMMMCAIVRDNANEIRSWSKKCFGNVTNVLFQIHYIIHCLISNNCNRHGALLITLS